ncbi:MAG TPA: ATPase domain-containing protein [Pyrinomonadaceae bacterium]|jgi:circadian clock protein KaiC|nr:ATPase domain-containing protein [Pyrinomonadaceae bacterium]
MSEKKATTGDPAAAASAAQSRLATGSAGLDTILDGGLPANRLYLVEGDPGAGKTTLAMKFLIEGAARGEAVLYVTLSETKEELTAVAASHGWTLAGINIHELVPPENALLAEEQYTIFHPSEVELGDTTKTIIEEVERTEPRRVVFDSLSEMRLLARDPLRYRRQILALKQYFAGRQCTVLLLDDRTATDADLQVQSIAHGVIALEHLALDYGAERRRLRVTKLRGSRFRGGFHDFTIKTGGVEVYPRLVVADHRHEFTAETISSDVPELDALLGGGLDRGTSTLLMGPAGSGKSSLAAQFVAAAAMRGERAATFIFDEGLTTYLKRADGLCCGLRAEIEAGRVSVQQVDPAELSPGEFAHFVRVAVERDGAGLVVIDSLNGYLQAMPDERFLTAQMHELLTYLNQRGVVTILILAQHGFMGTAMNSPVDVSYLADGVVLLRYFEAGGAIRRAVSVIKKRTGAHEDTIRELRLSSGGITVGEPLSDFHGVLTGVPTYSGGVGRGGDLLPGGGEGVE